MLRIIFTTLLFILGIPFLGISNSIVILNESDIKKLGPNLLILEDTTAQLSAHNVFKSNQFKPYTSNLINYDFTSSVIWIKLSITNKTSQSALLQVPYALIDDITFFRLKNEKVIDSLKLGIEQNYFSRQFDHPNFVYDLQLEKNETGDYLIRIESDLNIVVPIEVASAKKILESNQKMDFMYGGYVGIFLIMVLYNIFLYLSTRDKTTLYYVLYIPFVCILQLANSGYLYKALSLQEVIDPKLALFLITPIQVYFGTLFFTSAIPIKTLYPKLGKILDVINWLFIGSLPLTYFEFYKTSYIYLNLLAIIIGLYIIFSLALLSKDGLRTAKLFLAAFSLYFIGLLLFVSKNLGLLPYNNLTVFTATAGSIVDIFLLSIALGDRINLLKKENSQKQQLIIEQLRENQVYLKKTQEYALNTEKLERERLISEFEVLKNQVNPHFLFNSLNVLTELVEENKEEAVHFINELSLVYRYVLTSRNKNLVALEEEINFIHSFVYLLKIRYGENFEVKISEDVPKAFIPPLSLQVLVENAIKHNIISESNPLVLTIETVDEYLVVSNPIRKKNSLKNSTGIGLKNINSRIEFFSSKTIEIHESNELFTVKVPFVYKNFLKPAELKWKF